MLKIVYIVLVTLLLSCNSDNQQQIEKSSKNKKNITNTSLKVDSNILAKKINLSEELTINYLESKILEPNELRILRNEIYARKGYLFKSEDLREYFSQFKWYSPLYDASEIENYLTQIDKDNIKIIAKLEEKLKKELELKKNWDDFSFKEFAELLPEFKLPMNYMKREAIDKVIANFYYSIDPEIICKFSCKFFIEGDPDGKITLNDSTLLVFYTTASDLEVHRSFNITKLSGEIINSIDLTITDESSFNFNYAYQEYKPGFETENYSNTIITEDFKLIIKDWHVFTLKDSVGLVLEKEYSDTTTRSSDLL